METSKPKLAILLESIFVGERPTTVDLSNCELDTLPLELLLLADCLEVLNLGGNNLCDLPLEMILFKKLRILFFAQNKFEYIPDVLGQLPALYMLSFKSNMLRAVTPQSLSPSLGWLILTDNAIESLPPTIGNLTPLRKLMLAGNRLRSLPPELERCRDLELLRIANNQLESLPRWLLLMPKLAWIAFAGNPFGAEFNHVSSDSE